MNDYERATKLRLQAHQTYADILNKQLDMTKSIDELVGIVYGGLTLAEQQNIKDIQDKIFAYRIEMEAMHVIALRLLNEANALDDSND